LAQGAVVAEATDEVTWHPAFVEILRADRASFNRRFAQRQRAGARIDDTAFGQHLRTTVNALVADVAKLLPERVRAVVNALFDVSLDLFAAGLLGPSMKHPHVASAWREVLPQTTKLLARDPMRIAGSLSNAVDHMAAHRSARPPEWIALMRDLSPHCDTMPLWLDAGKVAAWRAGMVQYRSAALRLIRALPWELAVRCMGAPVNLTELDWHKCLERLESDRWFSPVAAKADATSMALRIVGITGGFRGFGGPCLRPPTVTASDGALFVSDGDAIWQLLTDAFGTFWQRVPTVPAPSAAPLVSSKVVVDSAGQVAWNGTEHEFSELAEASSYASDGETLALTLPTSHLVFLVAGAAS
jgi:hypothetical protein